MLDFRTDMADERVKLCEKEGKIEGITSENIDITDKIKLTKVKVLDDKGKEKIGKEIGTYVTLEIREIEIVDREDLEKASDVLAQQLRELIKEYN